MPETLDLQYRACQLRDRALRPAGDFHPLGSLLVKQLKGAARRRCAEPWGRNQPREQNLGPGVNSPPPDADTCPSYPRKGRSLQINAAGSSENRFAYGAMAWATRRTIPRLARSG